MDLDRLVGPIFGMCIWHRMGINLPGVMPEGSSATALGWLAWYLEFEMILTLNRENCKSPKREVWGGEGKMAEEMDPAMNPARDPVSSPWSLMFCNDKFF